MSDDHKPYRLPFCFEAEEDFARFWARRLGGGDDFQARILATLEGAEVKPLFDEDQSAPSDAASKHYWFLIGLAELVAQGRTSEGEKPCLPCLADISSNPVALLASRGNAVAQAVYSVTCFEKEWPQQMQDLDLTADALAYIGAIFRRFGLYKPAFLSEALEELFNPRFVSRLSYSFDWQSFRHFWRRSRLLECAAE